MSSLPFVIHNVPTVLIDLEGIARLEADELVLEFRARFVLRKSIKSRTTREVRIPVADLEEVKFSNRLFGGVVKFRARRLGAFGSMPGTHGSELRLRCRREHRVLAQDLVSRLSMRITEQELRQLVSDVPPARQTPQNRQVPSKERPPQQTDRHEAQI